MTRSEWLELARLVNAHWSHHPWTKETVAAGWTLVPGDLPYGQGAAAAQACALDGREFPPTPGQLVRKALDLNSDLPEWGAVWREVVDAVRRFGLYARPVVLVDSVIWERGDPEAEVWSDPLIAELVSQIGWRDLCAVQNDDLHTFQAQSRNKWEALVRRQSEDRAYRALPSAGLKRLESARGFTSLGSALEPKQLGEGR